jgi:hypothetical protein
MAVLSIDPSSGGPQSRPARSPFGVAAKTERAIYRGPVDVREGRIRRLIINMPPRLLKSLMASIAFPAWCLGHDPSAQILCVSYALDLADKLARDCRSIMLGPWCQQIFSTRLAPHRQAVQEFLTTRQGYRLPPRTAAC